MAHILIMPRQGNTVESCIITGWKVKEGDIVTPETPACDVETDKAAFEIPAGFAGTVIKILRAPGDDVPVLQAIAVIGAPGEDWQAALPEGVPGGGVQGGGIAAQETQCGDAAADAPVVHRPPNEAAGASLPGCGAPASPRARRLAEREALLLEKVAGSGPGGRIIERDVAEALRNRPPLTAAAKADRQGVAPAAGTGIGGRITAADMSASAGLPAGKAAAPPIASDGAVTETPIKGIRKIISDRMLASLAGSAQFTLNASASAVKLQDLRGKIKTMSAGAGGALVSEFGLSHITINDLILFAVSRTLKSFPFMNAHKTGDVIKTFERVHLAVAVDTPRGLMVPVIRNANLLSLPQISAQAKRLAADCQNGCADPAALSGSTFTVSNLGNMGITSFTPVLNAPEVAILGVCGIEMKPVAVSPHEAGGCSCGGGGCSGARFEPHIGFSLTVNHQAVDGAPAARFLKSLVDAVANIDLLLADG